MIKKVLSRETLLNLMVNKLLKTPLERAIYLLPLLTRPRQTTPRGLAPSVFPAKGQQEDERKIVPFVRGEFGYLVVQEVGASGVWTI